MGKNDYQKSYTRQIETIVTVIVTIYCATALILGYQQGWNIWGQVAVFGGVMVSWVFYLGKYWTFERRAYLSTGVAQIVVLAYAVAVDSFYSTLTVFISLCVLLGLYGIPKLMLIPTTAYVMMLFYFIFVDKSLVWGSYSSDLGMVTRILQGFLVLFAIFYLVYRYKKSHESMLEMIDALRKSEREKDDFLANVSHEIRTPINSICGISEIMINNGVPAEMNEDILNIQSAGRNLMLVVGDILDYSELQGGDFELAEENYYVSSTINDIINMTMAKKSEKNIELIVDCDANIPSVLIGDEQKIRRIVMNLVNNAIEFTSEGCVSLEFGFRREEYGINLIITVRDTGIGMTKESVEKLFQKFSQADMGRTRKKGGVGLGLAIAQAIVNKMGGFISVKSELGRGSEFRVVIPQKIYEEKPLAEIPNKLDTNAAIYINMEQFAHPTIRDEYGSNIRHIVEQSGAKCKVFRNLLELKRWVKREEYTQIFISLVEYQEDPAFFDTLSMSTKLYMILDRCNDSLIQNRLIVKIYKPFSILSIVASLKSQIQNETSAVAVDDTHQLYAPDAKILVVDDNRMNIRVVEGLLKEYGVQVVYALSGKEGIEKLESKDFDLVFLDHMMPEMDGVETLHYIRKKQNPYYKQVPIVALTANAIAGAREMLIKEGFDDFVAKPVESSVLQRALKRHIPITKQKTLEDFRDKIAKPVGEKQVVEKETMLPKEATASKEGLVIGDLDVSKGIMYCGNEKNYIEILKTHRDNGTENIEHIEGLLKTEDWKNYTIVVHGIKSSMMSIGAVKLSEMAKALEMAGKTEKYDYIQAEHHTMIEEYHRVLDVLNHCPLLGPVEEKETVCEKPAIEEEQFNNNLTELENAMYELDGNKMLQILLQLGEYSYHGKDLEKELQPVHKKVEMSDYMSAYETAVKLKDKISKA